MNIREFRDTFDLVEYCKGRGKYVRSGSNILVCCPNHEDSNPSCLVDPKRSYCFTCNTSLEAIDFVGISEGRTRVEILKREGLGRTPSRPVSKVRPEERRKDYTLPDPRYVERGARGLWRNTNALAYLQDRGIRLESIKEHKLGYLRPPTKAVKYPRFSFPCYDENGTLVSIVYRADPYYEPDSRKKYVIHPKTPASLFGMEKYLIYRGFLYTGGQIDAILLRQSGYPALGPTGEGTFKIEWGNLLRKRKIYLLLDNDEAGRDATKRLLDFMPRAIPIEWPTGTEGYDAADLINDPLYGEEGLEWMLKNVGGDKNQFRAIRTE